MREGPRVAEPESPHVARAEPVLAFSAVSKTFADGTEAFQRASFELRPRELVSLVGPSGCGKTTILKVASGLLSPSDGFVGRAADSIGYVFQDPTLLPWRSVLRNAELMLELDGVEKEERRRRAREALQLVGLRGFEGHLPRQLSGGMRMRVSLARSVATKPQLFLFDEPFGSLDEISREHLNEELSQLFAHEEFAGLFVTHSIFDAVFLSTRVLVMSPRPGHIAAEFEVPFTYPRGRDLRFDPEFTSLANQVGLALREAAA